MSWNSVHDPKDKRLDLDDTGGQGAGFGQLIDLPAPTALYLLGAEFAASSMAF
jgi:hypothetical protein